MTGQIALTPTLARKPADRTPVGCITPTSRIKDIRAWIVKVLPPKGGEHTNGRRVG